jgi:alpha,alpha-trehalase
MKQLVRSLCIFVALLAPAQVAAPARAPIQRYIVDTWDVLTRSHRELAQAAVDPKSPPLPDGRWPVYLSQKENLAKVKEQLRQEMAPGTFSKIELRVLPTSGLAAQPGLLYLPYPYAVPGGRFNEMYGWDSYFIVLGLLHDHKIELAKNMVDNFLYEIRYYGKILNANRTYYLSRSQPPFLSEMLLEVYRSTNDKAWLQNALPALIETHRFWTTPPHLTAETGLSRYFDFGTGPAPEVLSSEKDEHGRNHYDLIKDYYREHDVDDYDLTQYLDRAHDQLKPLFYKGDRSMRESGFDPSNRFGPFNIDIIHYNPVCLNSLLYLMEQQTAEILQIVGRGSESKAWLDRSTQRAARINELTWDEKDGLYYDYNFERRRVRHYPFLTTFFPLWAGIASKEQAARVVSNLPKFEQPGGLQTSTFVSGNQWDAPYAWAPLQMIAVEGMRRYGFNSDADRVTKEFLSLVQEAYQQDGIIVEKYDVVRRATSVSGSIRFGYRTNEPGFGWTNAVYTRLSDELTDAHR